MLHCAGNDIGQRKSTNLLSSIKHDIDYIAKVFNGTTIVWSQILPRLHWRGELDHNALEKVRKRVNNVIASYVLKSGGKYLRYPAITNSSIEMFCDGVHLSHKGNQVFLTTIKDGLQSFFYSDANVFPDDGQSGRA